MGGAAATVDMIPAVMTDVVRLLKHDRELVRKKAVMVLHRMNQLDPDVSMLGFSDRGTGPMGLALFGVWVRPTGLE